MWSWPQQATQPQVVGGPEHDASPLVHLRLCSSPPSRAAAERALARVADTLLMAGPAVTVAAGPGGGAAGAQVSHALPSRGVDWDAGAGQKPGVLVDVAHYSALERSPPPPSLRLSANALLSDEEVEAVVLAVCDAVAQELHG
jgi:hypothetical protein